MGVRVLIVTQWFDPEPTFKGLAFARELSRQGFDVTVLTGIPNYPTGRIYPGYHMRLLQRELIDGVRIYRVPLFPSHDDSALRRALNYASFAASSLLCGLFVARRADVIYVYHPPLTVGVSGALIGAFSGKPVVYDVQDMWPDTLRATGMVGSTRLLGALARVCRWVYGRARLIAVLSPGFKRLLVERGVAPDKVHVIYNWADEASIQSAADRSPTGFPAADRFRLLFAGNMGAAQALDKVLDAAVLLQRRGSRVTIVLMGGGMETQRLRDRTRELQLDNVVFLPAVPMTEVGAYLAAADALLVHLRDDPLFTITIPSKTQAYMAAGKPILLAVRGDAAELVETSGGGVTAAPENAAALADAADALSRLPAERLAAMGRQGRDYYHEHLAIEKGVASFGRLFRELAASPT